MSNEEYWIFTFGCGQKYAGKYVKIYANNSMQARQKMMKKYGDKWAFQYSREDWETDLYDPDRTWKMETELEVIR